MVIEAARAVNSVRAPADVGGDCTVTFPVLLHIARRWNRDGDRYKRSRNKLCSRGLILSSLLNRFSFVCIRERAGADVIVGV